MPGWPPVSTARWRRRRGAGRDGAVAGAPLGDPGAGAVPLRPPGRRAAVAGPGPPDAGRAARHRPRSRSWSSWRRRSCARTPRSAVRRQPAAVSDRLPVQGAGRLRRRRRRRLLRPRRRDRRLSRPAPLDAGCWSSPARRGAASRRWCAPGWSRRCSGRGQRRRRVRRRAPIRSDRAGRDLASDRGRAGAGGRPVRGAVHPRRDARRRVGVLRGGSPATPRDGVPVVVARPRRPPRRASPSIRLRPPRRARPAPRQPADRRRAARGDRGAGAPGRAPPRAGLVDLLVRDTEGEPGALPLLSHALAETWRRRDGNVLTVEGYRGHGRDPRRGRPLGRPALRQPARRAARACCARPAAARRPVAGRRPGAVPGPQPQRWSATPTASGSSPCWSGPGWSPPRRTPSSSPTRRWPGRGRGCGRGSTRTPPGNASCATSPPPPTAGTRSAGPTASCTAAPGSKPPWNGASCRARHSPNSRTSSSTPPRAATDRTSGARGGSSPGRETNRRLRPLLVFTGLVLVAAIVAGVVAVRQADRARRRARRFGSAELAATAMADVDVDPERGALLALAALDRAGADDDSVRRDIEQALHMRSATCGLSAG